jgi:peptidoglycan/LPS O-acetylase OafA/YrhL
LDGVRALAITAVFLHHAFKIRLLWMGVDLFFILSGFLITGILLQHKTQPIGRYFAEFYNRRVRRILPPYLLLLIVTTILFGVAWMRYAYLYVMLMNVIRALSLERPVSLEVLWSLAVEEQFYLLWPFAVYLLSEAALGWTAAVSGGAGSCAALGVYAAVQRTTGPSTA